MQFGTAKNLDKMDICIIYEEPGADMATVFKGRLKFGLFASLDYLSVFGRPKSIEDLQKNHKICTRDNFASVWPRWKEILDGAQNVVASTNATAVLLSLIRDGNGVSLHPIGSASREKIWYSFLNWDMKRNMTFGLLRAKIMFSVRKLKF